MDSSSGRVPLPDFPCPSNPLEIKSTYQSGSEMSSQSKEVKLIRIPGGINAESIVAALHGRGIPARTRGEVVGAIYGLTLDGLGEVSIFVPEDCLEEARSILAAGEHGDLMLGDRDEVDGIEPDDR
jgi:hypothetical protein